MRKFVLVVIVMSVLGNHLFAQNQYETITGKKGEKILKGIISREVLETDTSFQWYAQGQKAYSPNSVALSSLKQYGDSIQLIAFMGTWCPDSHFIIPRFYSLLDAANFSKDKISLIGVDRSKKTLSHLTEALDIKNVPTLIIMKDGKELGRVVEYGKTGQWDKELGEIIHAAFTK